MAEPLLTEEQVERLFDDILGTFRKRVDAAQNNAERAAYVDGQLVVCEALGRLAKLDIESAPELVALRQMVATMRQLHAATERDE